MEMKRHWPGGTEGNHEDLRIAGVPPEYDQTRYRGA
jgi:hypothetical protein